MKMDCTKQKMSRVTINGRAGVILPVLGLDRVVLDDFSVVPVDQSIDLRSQAVDPSMVVLPPGCPIVVHDVDAYVLCCDDTTVLYRTMEEPVAVYTVARTEVRPQACKGHPADASVDTLVASLGGCSILRSTIDSREYLYRPSAVVQGFVEETPTQRTCDIVPGCTRPLKHTGICNAVLGCRTRRGETSPVSSKRLRPSGEDEESPPPTPTADTPEDARDVVRVEYNDSEKTLHCHTCDATWSITDAIPGKGTTHGSPNHHRREHVRCAHSGCRMFDERRVPKQRRRRRVGVAAVPDEQYPNVVAIPELGTPSEERGDVLETQNTGRLFIPHDVGNASRRLYDFLEPLICRNCKGVHTDGSLQFHHVSKVAGRPTRDATSKYQVQRKYPESDSLVRLAHVRDPYVGCLIVCAAELDPSLRNQRAAFHWFHSMIHCEDMEDRWIRSMEAKMSQTRAQTCSA